MPAYDEGDLAAPGVDEAGPAGVDGDVLAVSCTEADGGVVERLTSILQNCDRVGEMSNRNLSTLLVKHYHHVNEKSSYSFDAQPALRVGRLGAD